MANIKLVRIDFRLIHGQIVNKWIKVSLCNRIIVIDDALASNPFMRDVYAMAAPPNVQVDVFGKATAIQEYNNNKFGEGTVLVLFKNVKDAYEVYNMGFEFPELQIGGLGAAPGRKIVFGPITLDQKDLDMLVDLDNKGVRVYFHQVPDDPSAELEKIKEKFNK